MLRYRSFAVAAVALPLSLSVLLSCGKSGGGNPAAAKPSGSIEIRARVVNPSLSKEAAPLATVADSLVVNVTGADMEPVRIARRVDLSRPSASETFSGIPAGSNRTVEITAVAAGGAVTHIDSLPNHSVTIESGKAALVQATLIPAVGSIYLQFTALPTGGSVYAKFAAIDQTFAVEATVNRDARTSVNLDYIPHNTVGVLSVVIYSGSGGTGDTLRFANQPLTFNARGDNNILLDFQTIGGGGPEDGSLNFDITVYQPGVTIVSYYYGDDAAVEETGELIITEILFTATDNNYIELYNTTNTAQIFDTLVIDVYSNSTSTAYRCVNVTVNPHGYLVVGRSSELAHVDIQPITGSMTNFIVGTGNWIIVKRKNGAIIDRVIHEAGTNSTGWPPVSASGTARRSIELARNKYNSLDNNFGKNWSSASEPIEGLTDRYGTPGR